jgi:hypothetical protein
MQGSNCCCPGDTATYIFMGDGAASGQEEDTVLLDGQGVGIAMSSFYFISYDMPSLFCRRDAFFFPMNRRDVVATLFCSRALTLKRLTCIFPFWYESYI